jgi:glycosyltransferase involved in cell wall biosynthesis
MRILHLVTTLSPGGAEHHVLSLAGEQIGRGHQVAIAYLKGNGALRGRFLEVGCSRVDKVPLERATDALRAIGLLSRLIKDADVIHTHLLKANVLGGLTALVGGHHGAVIATKHSDEPSLRKPAVGAIHGLVSRLCDDQVIAVSDHVGAFVSHYGHVAKARIRTIHNCFDPNLYPAPKQMDLRREFQLPPDSFVFGIVALVKEAKNHRLLLRAFAQLIASFPKARLIIVGDQGQYPSSYMDLVKSDIRSLSLDRYVTLTGWRADSFNIIGALDCMVMPSAWEGFGIVFLESLVQGVPVISTRVSGIPEVIRDGVDGFLVESQNAYALKEAMGRMITEYERIRDRVQSQGPPYVLNHFSLQAMVDQIQATYEFVLSQKKKTRTSRGTSTHRLDHSF